MRDCLFLFFCREVARPNSIVPQLTFLFICGPLVALTLYKAGATIHLIWVAFQIGLSQTFSHQKPKNNVWRRIAETPCAFNYLINTFYITSRSRVNCGVFFRYLWKYLAFDLISVLILKFSEWKVLVRDAGIQIGSPSPAYWAFGQPECSLNPSCDDCEASQQEASLHHRTPLIRNPGYPTEHPQGVVSWGGIGSYWKNFSS